MKKQLMIAGASLLLISGLTAGVFAKYESSLDTVSQGTVNAKEFQFVAAGTNQAEFIFTLAPGESESATIAVTNKNGTKLSQVDMTVNFDCVADIDAAYGSWLSYDLVKPETLTFSANVESTITATLNISLSEDATTAILGKTATFTVSATAEQVIPA